MSLSAGWDKYEQARKVIALLKPGSYVNLGIGMPGLVADQMDENLGIYLHCENGLIGYRGLYPDETIDIDVIDAASKPVGLINGASVVAHDVSFAIARGGRLDTAVLGAFQVSEFGDLANWMSPNAVIAGVGGAMDLAVGARQVIAMMKHVDKVGEPKIVRSCTYPLTARNVVDYIVSEYAVIAISEEGLIVEELAEGVTEEFLESVTAAPLKFQVSTSS